MRFSEIADALPALPEQIQVAAGRPLRAAQQLLARTQLLKPATVGPPIDIVELANLCGVQVVERMFPDDNISGLLSSWNPAP